MLRGLGGAVAALAQQPVGRTQSQRGACQRGYLGENLAWSDLSRGALRWVDGADEHAQHAGFSPRLSGVKSEDEALYIAHHHHWQTLMLAAIEQEQQRYDQSITQRVEVA